MTKERCEQGAKGNGTEIHAEPGPETMDLKVRPDQELQDDMHPKQEAPVIQHRTGHTPADGRLAARFRGSVIPDGRSQNGENR